MKRFLPFLILTGLLFGQDVLRTVSGKEYKGEYLKTEGGKVFFIPEGAGSPTQVPIVSINEIITETGKKISFLSTLIMKDGTVIKGSLTMISIDFIRFLKENETTPVDIQKDDIKSLTGYNINVKSPKNSLTLEENQKISNKNLIIISCIIVVVIIALVVNSFSLNFGSSGGLNCGPPCGGSIDVDYP